MQLREAFDLRGCPLRFVLRGREVREQATPAEKTRKLIKAGKPVRRGPKERRPRRG